MKQIVLGFNTNVVTSKEEGSKVEQFKPISFNIDKSAERKKLEAFFKSHVYTTNRFIGRGNRGQKLDEDYEGYAGNSNYQGMYGISIDYDDGFYTVEQAHVAYSAYVHIIHTSTSHMLDIPRHKGIQERFRVILPFEISSENPYLFENAVDAELVYSLMHERYPEADKTVFSMGRKLYPFTGDEARYKFLLHVPDKPAEGNSSIYYTLSFDDLNAHKLVLEAKLDRNKRNKKRDKLNRTDVVIMKDRRTKKRIDDINSSGTGVFCLFCDDLDSDTASAQINIDKHGNYNMYCHHCNKTYWEQDLNWKTEAEPNLFFDAMAGHAGLFDTETGQLKYFKNDKDWASYTVQEDLPKEIFTKLPRCNKSANLILPYGVQDLNGKPIFNVYYPSPLLENFDKVQDRIQNKKQKKVDISGLASHIPYIWAVLSNVFGPDEKYRDLRNFLNWLAYIIQMRVQSSMAWILITNPGTGKGVIAELILRPIFGKHSVIVDEGNAIGAQFNAEDISCWFKVYNEVFTKSDFTQNLRRREWLKNRIGTNEILIEAKGLDKRKFVNFINYLLLSNIEQAFMLEHNDRRFYVVNTLRSSRKIRLMDWWKGREDFEKGISGELEKFAHYIQNIEFDEELANEPTDTPARRKLIESSLEDIDFIINKLNEGKTEYLELENIYPSSKALIGIDPNSDIRAEIEEFIELYRAIPSKYAVDVFGHFLKTGSRANIKRRLEQKGMIIGKQIWIKEKKANIRVYIHESQV